MMFMLEFYVFLKTGGSAGNKYILFLTYVFWDYTV